MAALIACVTSGTIAQPSARPIPESEAVVQGPPRPPSVRGDFTVASVGDLINARPVSPAAGPGLQKLLAIVRTADVAIGNREGVFFDLKSFHGYAPGSPYILLGEPTLAHDLKAIGIDMVSTANNHSNDWGIEGLLAMDALLDRAGIVHAGDGPTLADAVAPRYFETPKGRVALIATASTFKQGATAQDAVDGMPARPGISTLRLREISIVTASTMRHLRIAAGRPNGTGDLVMQVNTRFGQPIEQIYRVGPYPHFSYEMSTFDHAAILSAIRAGKRNADLAVFTIHAHENADGMDDQAMGHLADFLVQLSHKAIDAGADIVMGGGPHSMRGIEIYKGRPIFYGLAVFLFKANIVVPQEQQTEHYGPPSGAAIDRNNPKDRAFHAPESWNDGFVAVSDFRDGKLKEVRIYPLDHARTGEPSDQETTHFASPTRARRILEALQKFSAIYGTRIAIEGSIGVIRP